jgi:phage major head subunit gpT-like protein
MAIANQDAVADARTTYEALVGNALQNARASGVYKALSKRINSSGIAHQLTLPGATPTWAEWTDARDAGGFRKYTKTIPRKVYHKTISLSRVDVTADNDGSTAMALEQFVGADVEAIWDKLVIDALVSNPTGLDGVALVSDTHPFGSSTTWDNKTTTALSFSSFNTERARMRALKDEYGEPLNLEPRILLVHPDEEEVALQIAQSDQKPVSVGTAGAINSAGVGGSAIANVFRGNVDVIVSPRWTSGDWVIIDPRYMPIALCVWRYPETVVLDGMGDPDRFKLDKFIYGVEADVCADGAQPWGIAGKIT